MCCSVGNEVHNISPKSAHYVSNRKATIADHFSTNYRAPFRATEDPERRYIPDKISGEASYTLHNLLHFAVRDTALHFADRP